MLNMSTLEERIQEMMDVTKLTVPEIAGIAGVTPSAVSQWLGQSARPTKTISLEPALLLERKTGFSALWLSKGKGPKMADRPRANTPSNFVDIGGGLMHPSRTALPPTKKIKVSSMIKLDRDGSLERFPASGDVEVVAHGVDVDAYALQVSGSRLGLIQHGYVLVVSPSRAPKTRCPVIVCTTDGKQRLMNMLVADDAAVTLDHIMGDGQVTLLRSEIEFVHAVVNIIPGA